MVLNHRAKFQLIINFFRVKAISTGLYPRTEQCDRVRIESKSCDLGSTLSAMLFGDLAFNFCDLTRSRSTDLEMLTVTKMATINNNE